MGGYKVNEIGEHVEAKERKYRRSTGLQHRVQRVLNNRDRTYPEEGRENLWKAQSITSER